jgi:hypothetical protein
MPVNSFTHSFFLVSTSDDWHVNTPGELPSSMHLFGKREGERTSHCFVVFVNREGDAENRCYEKKNWEASGTDVPVHHAAVEKLIPARGNFGKVVDYAVAVTVALARLFFVDAWVVGRNGFALHERR